MSSNSWITSSTGSFSDEIRRLAAAIEAADAVVVGAGAGLSTAAGFTYAGERFRRHFADFEERFGFHDMYSGGFYPFPDAETTWAYWSRNIWVNRYDCPVGQPYLDLLACMEGRNYFVLTTNVDHQFQRAGIPRERLFYTQGDYGLWQCSVPCHSRTYDNYDVVRKMIEQQRDLRVPSELVPMCPVCGKPMSMNLRADATFVEDEGWHAAAARYESFLEAHVSERILFFEIGVGGNTPAIIKYPFLRMTLANPQATYAQLNYGEVLAPDELEGRCILIDGDAAVALAELRKSLGRA